MNFVLARPPLGLGMMQIGLVYLVFAPSIATTALAGRLTASLGPRVTAGSALGLAAVGAAALLVPSVSWVLAGLALVGVGTFLAQAVTTGFVGHAARSDRGAASGLYLGAYFAGGLAAPCWAPCSTWRDGRRVWPESSLHFSSLPCSQCGLRPACDRLGVDLTLASRNEECPLFARSGRLELTYCGRSGPRPWTPQLGGVADGHGAPREGPECAPSRRSFASAKSTSPPICDIALS